MIFRAMRIRPSGQPINPDTGDAMRSTILPPWTLIGHRADGRPIYNIAGGSSPEPPNPPAPADPTPPVPAPPPNPAPTPPTPPPAPPKGDQGFPADTPLTEMTVEQREQYWKSIARKHEATVKARSDYDDLKVKAAEADRLRQESETAAEKAVREATERARGDALAELRPQLVQAKFEAAAAGRIEAERLATLTDDIDMSRYLKDDGTVDVDKVTAKVEAWAPKSEPPRGPKPDPTQGARNTKTTGTDVGRDMFNARRNKTPAS